MCCFSRPVELIADTNIFARAGKDGRQYLVYAMTMSAKEDLAMILPIPTPKASKEDAVKFLNLGVASESSLSDMGKGLPPHGEGASLPRAGAVTRASRRTTAATP